MRNRIKTIIPFWIVKKSLAMFLTFTMCLGLMPAMALADNEIDISKEENYVEVTPNYDWPLIYNGEVQDLLDVTVKVNGRKLIKGTDYTVEYDKDHWKDASKADGVSAENGVIGKADATLDFPIKVTGKGNYTGTWRSLSNGSGGYSVYANEGRYRIMPRPTESSGTPSELWRWSLDSKGLLTVTGSGDMPDTFNSINGDFLPYQEYIKKVVINGNILTIPRDAFNSCINLTDVTLPTSITSIGERAFNDCKSLQSIHSDRSDTLAGLTGLTTIVQNALGINTYNLTVHLPDNVTTVEINNVNERNRIYCKHGTDTENTLKALKGAAHFMVEGYEDFYLYVGKDGYGMEEHYTVYKYVGPGGNITIPDIVEGVGHPDIFGYDTGSCRITGLTIPKSIRILNVNAFRKLTNCTEIEIKPGSLKTLPAGIFSDASNATVTIPDTVTTLEGDPAGENALLIVGPDSDALTWAKGNGYEEYDGSSTTGKRYQIRPRIQPSVSPNTANMEIGSITELKISKDDGSFRDSNNDPAEFTFAGLKNGSTVLTADKDYSVAGDTVTIKASYLTGLGIGTHKITFDYNPGDGDGKTVEDPTLTIIISDHALVKHDRVEATEITDGNIEYWKCSVCGKYFSDEKGTAEISAEDIVIPKTGKHNLKKHDRIEPTEDKEGNIEYWECTDCGKLFSDTEGKNEISKEDIVIEKTAKPADPSEPGKPLDPSEPDKPSASAEPVITVSDNKPMAVATEKIEGDFNVEYPHEIPFTGKGKITPETFGEKFTVSQGNVVYKVTKIKVNKKKQRIQITGLEGADKSVVKAVKKATKGDKGIPYKQNPYYVRDTDKVTPRQKKDGSLSSVKVSINGKDYKCKKDEWEYKTDTKVIAFKGNNLAGSYQVK